VGDVALMDAAPATLNHYIPLSWVFFVTNCYCDIPILVPEKAEQRGSTLGCECHTAVSAQIRAHTGHRARCQHRRCAPLNKRTRRVRAVC